MSRRTLALLAALALPISAAQAQHIVGTTSVGGLVQLVDLVPSTGVATLIGSPTPATSLSGNTAIDATGNRYFFADGASTLWVVHSGSGTVIGSGAFSGVAFNALQDIEYDPTGNTLYGLVSEVGGDLQLVTIDHEAPGIGTMAAVGAGAAVPFQGGTSDLEHSTSDRFYFIGTNLRHIATATGAFTDTGGSPSLIQGTEADTDSGVLHAMQVNGTDRRIVVLNTADGTVGTTGPNIAGEDLSTDGRETSSSVADRYYFWGDPATGAARVYGIVTTAGGTFGTVDTDPLITGVTNLQNWEFDGDVLPVELLSFSVD
jgi:hypothetical protein